MKKLCTLTLSFLWTISLLSQIELDIAGDTKISGSLQLGNTINRNTLLGILSGETSTESHNTFLGNRAGEKNTSGRVTTSSAVGQELTTLVADKTLLGEGLPVLTTVSLLQIPMWCIRLVY